MAEVVQRLVGHPAGEGPVADEGDDAPGVLALAGEGRRDAVRVGQRRRGVGVLDPVVRGLRPVRVARQPAGLAQPGEALRSPRQQLVDVGLVAGVEQQHVGGRVEDAMERDRHLDRAEVRAEVAPGSVHRFDDEGPALLRERDAARLVEALHVGRRGDGGKEGVGRRVLHLGRNATVAQLPGWPRQHGRGAGTAAPLRLLALRSRVGGCRRA